VVNLSAPKRPGAVPADVPALLRALLDDDPGRPRVTWYGPGGERVELSAKVLDNWVAKTANLLVDELDAGPGSVVAIALPPHWRTVTWLLAVWSVGACAAVVPPGAPAPADADVVVSTDPGVLATSGARPRTVAVALPALATSYDDGLPDDAVDYALEVRSYGDVFVPFVAPVPGDPAFAVPGLPRLTHGALIPAASRAADDAGLPPRARLLTGAGPDDAVASLLAPLVRFGSVVLHHDLPALTGDPAALAALRRQEGVTDPPPP
jgi:uncharacterized protein (TIGR03089 family)